MIERTSGTQPRCLSYGGTVIILQPHGSLLPIPSKQEREREKETLVGSGHESPEQNLC